MVTWVVVLAVVVIIALIVANSRRLVPHVK